MPKPRRNKFDAPLDTQNPTPPRPVQILSCPVCDSLLGEQSLPEHMEAHRPVRACCKDHTEWRLDVDGVLDYRPDVSVFYCRPCGKYAPVA